MTDREMLELAAQAGGVDIGAWHESANAFLLIGATRTWWNPREDDGDAFRLEVACGLDMDRTVTGWLTVRSMQHDVFMPSTRLGDDPAAATRLAIVRAAAEIGRKMKEEGK